MGAPPIAPAGVLAWRLRAHVGAPLTGFVPYMRPLSAGVLAWRPRARFSAHLARRLETHQRAGFGCVARCGFPAVFLSSGRTTFEKA